MLLSYVEKAISNRSCERNDIAFFFWLVGDADPYRFDRLPRKVAHLIEHIFNENSVPRGGIVDEDVCHRSH